MIDISEIIDNIEKDGEDVTDVEVNEWEWKSYHKINVKQNMGNGRHYRNIKIVIILKIRWYNLPNVWRLKIT